MVEGGVKQAKKCKENNRSWTGLPLSTEDGFSLLQKGGLFFSVTLLLTLLLAAGVFYEMVTSSMNGQATAGTIGLSGIVPEGNGLVGLRNPLFLLVPIAVLFITLICGLFFFIRHIAVPLDKIGMATRLMTDGRLDKPVQIASRDEIGRIGELINDLAINTQEVLLYFWNHTQENYELIDRLEKKVYAHPDKEEMTPLKEEIFTQLKQGNNEVKSMILLYDFFDLKLEKEKVLINPQSK